MAVQGREQELATMSSAGTVVPFTTCGTNSLQCIGPAASA